MVEHANYMVSLTSRRRQESEGSPHLIQTPVRYLPRRTPHPPRLMTGIVKWLSMRTTWSLSAAGGEKSRGKSRSNPDSTLLSSSPNSSPSSSKDRNCQMGLSICTTWSLSGAGGDRGRGECRPNPDSTPLSSSPNSSPSSSKDRNCQMVGHVH